jgi:multidrug efflux pump subunit AcrA (membrane-fusion protein)
MTPPRGASFQLAILHHEGFDFSPLGVMRMKKQFGKFLLPALALGMLVFAVLHVVHAQQSPSKPPPPIEPARSPFGKTVAGAGIVEAESENISIGSPLPGVVLEVFVPVEKVGQVVKKGDPLFQVDDRQLKAQLATNEANLAAARAQVEKLKAQPRAEELPSSKAKWDAAKANYEMLRDQYERDLRLYPSGAVSQEDYRIKKMSLEVANQQALQAEADYKLLVAGAWKYDLDIAEAAVKQAEAQLGQTRTDLDRSLVRAPVDGKVLQVNVRPGEYVGTPPSQALVVLGSVASMHVRVDIDEHDIPRAYRYFNQKAPAHASPRGDPSMSFPLTFVRVEPYVVPKKSLTGDNTERVDTRVLQVIYRVEHDEPALFVGMQLDVFLDGNNVTSSPDSQ